MATQKHNGTAAPSTTSTRTSRTRQVTPKAAPPQKPHIKAKDAAPQVSTTASYAHQPTGPYRVSVENRRKAHYVLISDGVDGRYVHHDFTHPALTDSIWDAFVTDARHVASAIANEANDKGMGFGEFGKLGKLSVERAQVTKSGFVVGAEPHDSPDNEPPAIALDPLHGFKGSRVNTALAQAADVDQTFIDTLVWIHTQLSFSPMFVALVNDYKRQAANPEGIEPDWHLCQMSARLFYAGICAGRREAGQRTKDGELLMDCADFSYEDVKHLPITPLPKLSHSIDDAG